MSNQHQPIPSDWNQDRRPSLYGGTIFFLILGTTTVLARLGLQFSAHRKVFLDDLFIFLALIFNNALLSVDIYGMSKGLGLHIDRVMASDKHPPSTLIALWKVGWVNSLCIYLCLGCIKISLLCLYKRLFWIARWFRIAWYFNLGWAILTTVVAFFVAVFQCTPVSFAWNRIYVWTQSPAPFLVHGHCVSNYNITALAALSLSSDILIWILPISSILKLQMGARRKAELCILLSLGLVACACGLVKSVLGHSAISAKDVSWANAPLAIWASAEQSIGILCACVPVIAGASKSLHKKRTETSSAYRLRFRTASTNRDNDTALHKTSKGKVSERTVGTTTLGSSSTPDLLPPSSSGNDGLEMQPPRRHAEFV